MNRVILINTLSQRFFHPLLNSIIKCQNLPSIIAIRNTIGGSSFSLSHVTIDDISKEIKRLNLWKTNKLPIFSLGIHRKILIFLQTMFAIFLMNPLAKENFHPVWIMLTSHQFLEKVLESSKKIINVLPFFQLFQGYTTS